MNTKPQQPAPASAAAINRRMQEIGEALAARGGFPVPGARELEAELEQLQAAYRVQLDAESARPSAETMRQARQQEEREARLAKAIADATR